MAQTDIVVTGLGVASPAGLDVAGLWESLSSGRTGIGTGSAEQTAAGVPVVASVRSIGAARWPGAVKSILTRPLELLCVAGEAAYRDSDLTQSSCPRSRLGVVVGVAGLEAYGDDVACATMNCDDFNVATFAQAMQRVHPLRRLRHLPNIAAGLLAMRHDLHGAGITTVGSMAGALAIDIGYRLVASGRLDAVLCGGTDSRLTPALLSDVHNCWHISTEPDASRACRPLDSCRNGTVPGEGAAVLILESGECARRRRARTYAELTDIAVVHGIRRQWVATMSSAFQDIGVRPDILIANGDGGTSSDAAEARAITHVYAKGHRPLVTSIKGTIGHTLSASGAFNAVAACLTLVHQRVPAAVGTESPIEGLRVVIGRSQQVEARTSVAHTFSPEGASVAMAFRVSPWQNDAES